MKILQKAEKFGFSDAEVKTMRGITKIELYNPNTRIKKVYRDENTFYANHISRGIRNLGMADASPLNHDNMRNYPIWQEMVGGLFLFRDTIDNDDEYMPAGNRMIGNGAYGVSNGSLPEDPTEMGSYNYSESSYSDTAITQVYGFDTSQANGDISCVCLTSRTGGYIGYGNASGKIKSKWSFTRGVNLKAINIGIQESYGRRVATGNRIFYPYFEGNTLYIRTKRVPINKCTVFDNYAVETLSFDISEMHNKDYSGWVPSVSDGKVIISRSAGTLAAGATFYYIVYDPDTNTISEQSITNSSGEAIQTTPGTTVQHGKVFIPNYPSKYYVFDKATGIFEGMIPSSGYSEYYALGMPNGMAMVLQDGEWKFYDTVNKTVYPTNGSDAYFYDSVSDMMTFNDRYSLCAYNNPLYLATINNLEETVPKTAAQTMKVIYTLTKEED